MNIGGSNEVVEVGHLEDTPGHRCRHGLPHLHKGDDMEAYKWEE
jgi:hypothetical protein